MDSSTAKAFISAGKAIFTIENPDGKYFTFKVTRMTDAADKLLDKAFVSLLTGPENTKNYTYMGLLDMKTGAVTATRNSKISPDALSFKVAVWFLGRIWTGGAIPEGYNVHHEGRCGRCGRLLTVPTSIENGIGPECIKHLAPATAVS